MTSNWFNSFLHLDFYSMTIYFYYYENSIISLNNNFILLNDLSYYSLSDWTLRLYKEKKITSNFFTYSLYDEIPFIFSNFFINSNLSAYQLFTFSYDLSSSYSLSYLPHYNTDSHNLNYFVHCTIPVSKIEPFCWLWNQQLCSVKFYSSFLSHKINFIEYSNYTYDFFSYWFNHYNSVYNSTHLFFFENNIWNISRVVSWNLFETFDYYNKFVENSNTYDILFGSDNLLSFFDNSILVELNFNSGNFFELLSSQTFVYLLYYFGLKYYFISLLFF